MFGHSDITMGHFRTVADAMIDGESPIEHHTVDMSFWGGRKSSCSTAGCFWGTVHLLATGRITEVGNYDAQDEYEKGLARIFGMTFLTPALVGHFFYRLKEDGNLDLSGMNLGTADLNHCILRNANLCATDLSQCSLDGTLLYDSTYNDKTKWPRNFNPDVKYGLKYVEAA